MSTLSRNLKPLQTAGWVAVRAGDDARSNALALTAAGRRKRSEAQGLWKKAQLQLNDTVGVDDVIALHALIDRTSAALANDTTGRQERSMSNTASRYAVWMILLAAAGTFCTGRWAPGRRWVSFCPTSTPPPARASPTSAWPLHLASSGGLTQPFAGAFADRVGAGRVLLIGVSLVALGTILTPLDDQHGRTHLRHRRARAGGAGMAGPSVLMAATTRMLPAERRGMATGIVNAGGSFGQFIMAPVAAGLTAALGWMTSMQVLGADRAAGASGSVGVVGNSSAAAASAPTRCRWRRCARARRHCALHYPRICRPELPPAARLRFFVCGFHVAFLATHLPNVVAMCGLPPAVSAWSLGLLWLFNIVGSLAMGGRSGAGG